MEYLMAILFILFPIILILVGIYKLFAKLIDRGNNKHPKSYAEIAVERAQKAKELKKEISKEANDKQQKAIATVADKCPTCGGPVQGSEEKCRYCGVTIPQNVLFNKEKAMEQKSLELDYRIKAMEAHSEATAADKSKKIAKDKENMDKIKHYALLCLILIAIIILLKNT